jgi:hypothetical protein
MVIVKPEFPANDLAQFMEYARAHPNRTAGYADIRRTNSAPLSAARSRDGHRMPRPPASKQNSRDNGNGDPIMQPNASAGIIGLGFMGTASTGGLIEARVALIEGMRRQPVASEVIR